MKTTCYCRDCKHHRNDFILCFKDCKHENNITEVVTSQVTGKTNISYSSFSVHYVRNVICKGEWYEPNLTTKLLNALLGKK